MTIKELKKTEGYKFRCNITEKEIAEILDTDYFDEWDYAYVSLGENGEEAEVEYNLCIDNTTGENVNSSAIYPAYYNEMEDCLETDYSTFIHYEIDFNNPEWKAELENAMCKALIEFFEM